MTVGLYLLRVFQNGMTMNDIDQMTVGMVLDIFTESANDQYDWKPLATQKDFDAFREV